MPPALPALPDFVQDLGHGVFAVDSGFQRRRFDAAYLLVHQGRAAFFDTGPAGAVPRLLGALQALGLAPEAVDWIVPTHVHLDHAGGVGALMQACPNARLLVHPRGLRHMLDPAQLFAGAVAVYGPDVVRRDYGEPVSVSAERAQASEDGQAFTLAGRVLQVAHTPGHAKHHHCLWDETSRGWFAGDTFGLNYGEFETAAGPFMLAISTPVQFDPPALKASITRLLAARPENVYITHYGRIGGTAERVQQLGAQLQQRLQALAEMGRRAKAIADPAARHAALKQGQLDLVLPALAAHGCTLPPERVTELLALDLELNAQGLAVWLDEA